MRSSFACTCAIVSLLAVAAGCSSNNSNPAQPSGASSSGSQSASVVAPKPLQPANAAQIRNADQPVTLVIQNGLITGNATATYTFEVATDQAFANKVQTKDGVAQSSGSQTSVRLDQLAAGTDYYWHARTQGGGTTGVFSPVYKFSIGPAIVIQPPSPIGPANGSTTPGWPTLSVLNAARSGPVGALVYKFEISTSSTFGTVVVTGIVPETAGQTSFTPPASQPAPSPRTLFWRVTAVDNANGVSSPASTVLSFTYSDPSFASRVALAEGQTLWPVAVPPGTPGQTSIGGGWDIRSLTSFNGVTHLVPTIDELRVLDLLDRGMSPGAALAWMNSNGYFTDAVYYAGVGSALGVIGFQYEYMAHIDGAWGLVVRVGA